MIARGWQPLISGSSRSDGGIDRSRFLRVASRGGWFRLGGMDRFSSGVEVTWLSVAVNLILGLGKVGIGLWGQSRALVADGLHSLADLGTDAAVLAGFRFARVPSDEGHPYGHHKIASLVSGGIGLAILFFCGLLLIGSIRSLGGTGAAVPSAAALVTALVSLAVKEWLFQRTRRIAQRIRSRMLLANAWHHRTDSVSSVVAAAGIGASMVGGERFAFLDALAAVLLGGYLAVEAVRILNKTLNDLMDAAPEREIVDDLREHVLPTPGVRAYHAFRARRTGDWIEVDLHLLVDPAMTVEDGHKVARGVKENIMARHPEVIDVLVHVEPYLPEQDKAKGISDRNETAPRPLE